MHSLLAPHALRKASGRATWNVGCPALEKRLTPTHEHHFARAPGYQAGPHGYFELVRLARRGHNMLVRILYVLALLAVLWVVVVYFRRGQSV